MGMLREHVEPLKILWPAGVVGLGFGMVHCALLCIFRDALEALEVIDIACWGWGGPENLLFLNSLLLGWVSMWLMQDRLGVTGPIILAVGVVCWAGAIASGFGLAALFITPLPGPTWELAIGCIASAVVAGTFRMYTND